MSDQPGEQFDDPQPAGVETVACWRCGGSVEITLSRCPFCAAPPATARTISPTATSPPGDRPAPVLRVITIFAALLAVSVVHGLVLRASGALGTAAGEGQAGDLLASIAVMEGIDTVLVLVALGWIRLRRRPARPSLDLRALAWCVFVPVFGAMLALNVGYHWLLREVLDLQVLENEALGDPDLLVWWFVVICVQPALIEELFFRYLALHTLRSLLGVHAAVMISSLMFGIAHVGVPLSIPMLTVLGIALGYARVATGSMALPILLHLLHNAAVLGIEWYMLHGL